jgi:FlaA1/EpsC-like NDP-sugar epimerase
MELLTKFYLIIISVLIAINVLITNYNNTNNINLALTFLSYFLSAMFILGFFILQKYRNYIYFYLSNIFTSLVTILVIMKYGNLEKDKSYKFIVWCLVGVSILTYIGSIRFTYHIYYNKYNDSKKGVRGEEGLQGLKGKSADTTLNNFDLCLDQLNNQTNNQILKKKGEEENSKNYFNNLLLKQKFRDMCAKEFKN